MKPYWINQAGGSYVELGFGFRISVTMNREIKRYTIAFAGVGSSITFASRAHAKSAAVRLANDVIADVLLSLLELQSGDNGR